MDEQMTGYSKLFPSIIHSTVWREADHIRLVWVTMLAMKNRDGIVEASVPGLADAARVTLEECELALEHLSSPDPYSRTRDFDGRRINAVDGGWVVLNHEKYQDLESIADRREKDRIRQRRKRERDRVSRDSHVTITPRHAASREITPSTPSSSSSVTKTKEEGAPVFYEKENRATRLVEHILTHWPNLPRDQVEASVMKLLFVWRDLPLEQIVTQAFAAFPPNERLDRVHTWIAREAQFHQRQLERQNPAKLPPKIKSPLRALLDTIVDNGLVRTAHATEVLDAALAAGETLPDIVRDWIYHCRQAGHMDQQSYRFVSNVSIAARSLELPWEGGVEQETRDEVRKILAADGYEVPE